MRNAIIGLIIGIVAGIVLGTTVIAPRLAKNGGQENDTAQATQTETEPVEESAADVQRLRMASAFPETLPAYGTLANDDALDALLLNIDVA